MAKKSDEYFNSFIRLVDYSCQASEYLHDVLSQFDHSTLRSKMEELHKIEHAADIEKHELMSRLIKEFIAPLEREDINQLANEIDDLIDTIEDVLIRIYMYNIQVIRPEAIEFATLITQCCQALSLAVKELPNFHKSKTLHQAVVDVNTLEESGDTLYVDAMHTLFTQEKDAVAVIGWSETFDRLEDCCDACEHVADVMETVAMKNS